MGDTRELSVFDVASIYNAPQCSCLGFWDDRALVGLTNGDLVTVPLDPPALAEDAARAQRTKRGLTEGPVLQLQADTTRSMLLALGRSGVRAYRLPQLLLRAEAVGTHGCERFAWHQASGTLGVSYRRKVYVFVYEGLEFVRRRDVSLPDRVACIAFVGPLLCVGTVREYYGLDPSTGALCSLTSHTSESPCIAAAGDGVALCALGGREAARVRVSTEPGRGGVLGTLRWAGTPTSLSVSAPYAVATLQEGGAEARAVEQLGAVTLTQRLLPEAQLHSLVSSVGVVKGGRDAGREKKGSEHKTTSGNRTMHTATTRNDTTNIAGHPPSSGTLFDPPMLLACDERNSCLLLRQRPPLDQARALLALGEYEECLAAVASAPVGPERLAVEDAAHLRYAAALFRAKEFEESLLHFGASKAAGTRALLSLLPSLTSRRLLAALPQAPGEENTVLEEDKTVVERDSTSSSTDPCGATSLEVAVGPEPRGEEFIRAVSQVLPYLQSQRSREAARALEKQPTPERDGNITDSSNKDLHHHHPGASSSSTTAERLQKNATPTAVAIDTAILRALLVLEDNGALLAFVQRPNVVDLEEGRAALGRAGRYSELVALLQARGRHGDALDLLETLSQHPETLPVAPAGASAELRGLPGVWAATRCLVRLGRDQLPLLAQHAKWVVTADPDSALQQLVAAEKLHAEDVLPILTACAPRLAAAYLEEMMAQGRADPERFARPLASLYLQRVVEYARSSAGDSDPEAQDLPETAKVRALILRAGAKLDLDALLRLLPRDRLLELRAAVLERLGHHKEVLELFVRRLGRLGAAEAYCDRVYARQLGSNSGGGAIRRMTGKVVLQQRSRSTGRGVSTTMATSSPDVMPQDKTDDESLSLPLSSSLLSDSMEDQIPSMQLPALQFWLDRTDERRGGWGPDESRPSDIYLLLIQVLLEGGDGEGAYPSLERWADVAALLSRKRQAIEPLHALELLPSELPLRQARQFLHSALWGVQEERRNVAVRRALRRAEAAALELRVAQAKKRSITMAADRVCTLCYKRIGQGAAFAAFPQGGVAHYSCYTNAEKEHRLRVSSSEPKAIPAW